MLCYADPKQFDMFDYWFLIRLKFNQIVTVNLTWKVSGDGIDGASMSYSLLKNVVAAEYWKQMIFLTSQQNDVKVCETLCLIERVSMCNFFVFVNGYCQLGRFNREGKDVSIGPISSETNYDFYIRSDVNIQKIMENRWYHIQGWC